MEKVLDVLKIAASIVTAVCTALGSLAFGNHSALTRPAGARLTAALIADTHMTDAFYRKMIFKPGLKDMSKRVNPDLFVCAGDSTDNGNETNWEAFKEMLDKYLTVENKIITLGNHDTWMDYDSEHEYGPAKDLYLKYANQIMGTGFDSVYFTREINGYSFVIMGPEDTRVSETVSEQQIAWLRGAMADAAEKSQGKPIFVINHNPFNFTHGIGDNENRNGFNSNEECDAVREILDRYENVIYISGHTHFGLDSEGSKEAPGFTTVEKVGNNITSINLPCYEYGSFVTGGDDFFGPGIVMTVFDDRIELQGRNFLLGVNLEDFFITVPLT